MRAPLVAVLLVLGLCFAPTAKAETAKPSEVLTRLKPDDMMTILREAGYRVESVQEDNRWHIRTWIGGHKVILYLYDCENDGACGSFTYSLHFKAAPDLTLTLANTWNRNRRYAKAYIDTDGGLVIEYDLSFSGGVTRETIAQSARLFDKIVGVFDSMMNTDNK